MNTDTSTKERRLAFMRRMIWWLPALAFAIMATLFVVFGQGLMTAVVWGVTAGVVVGLAVIATYLGYKAMLNRPSS